MKAFRLDGEVAVITGGGSGLGFGMAKSFVEAGARVVLVGRREATLRESAESLGPSTAWAVGDVTDTAGIEDLARATAEAFGPPGILVNNAGVHLKKPAVDTSEVEFQAVLQTHVLGAHALSRALLPAMIERGRGSLLFISSMTAYIGMTNVIAYSAAKSAYLGMTRSLSAELAPKGIRVNAIAPGWIESPMLRKALDGDPERSRRVLQRTHLGRFGEPSDIGHAAVYLCSPAACFVTGTCLPIDGGASVGF